jgi:hypothetical protein
MGQPQFSQIVATASRESVINSGNQYFSTGTVPAGSNESVDMYAPDGTIANVLAMYLNANPPAGATTGTHSFDVLAGTAQVINYMSGTSVFSSKVEYKYNEFSTADSQKLPVSNEPLSVLRNIYFDSRLGLRFVYTNQTNAIQSGQRKYQIIYLKKVVG